jgi:hypothetical protein
MIPLLRYSTSPSLLFLLATVVSIGTFFHCSLSPTRTAGGSDTEVSGKVIALSGGPAQDARIALVPQEYVPGISSLSTVRFDTTNKDGAYRFSEVSSGTYNIEARGLSDGTRMLAKGVAPGTTADENTGTLRLPGFLKVPLTNPAGEGTAGISVEGTMIYRELSDEDRQRGYVILDSLPAAMLSAINLVTAQEVFVLADSAAVSENDTGLVDGFGSWEYRTTILLNTTSSGAGISENVSGFPLLVRLDSSTFDFSQARSDGADIRFAGEDGLLLPFEIDTWNPDAGVAAVWVLLDTVYGGRNDQGIRMYWGCSQAVNMSNGVSVFPPSDGYIGAWHLGDSDNSRRASATGGNHATPIDYDGDERVGGVVGFADSINDGCAIDLGAFNVDDTVTIETWVSIGNAVNWGPIIHKSSDTAIYPWNIFSLQLDSVPGDKRVIFDLSVDSADYGARTTTTFAPDQWFHVAGVRSGTWVGVYVNGVLEDTSEAPQSYSQNAQQVFVGLKKFFPAPDFSFRIDELRISRKAFSESWLKLSYETQKPGGTSVQFGR